MLCCGIWTRACEAETRYTHLQIHLNTAVNLPSRQVWRACHGFDITRDRRNCVFLARLAAAELFVGICVLLRIEVILVILPGFFGHFVDSSRWFMTKHLQN